VGVVSAAVLLTAAGCGGRGGGDGLGRDPGGEALVAPFEEAAEDAYEAADSDRTEDFNRGVRIEEGCFALDDDGAASVAGALGVDGAGDAAVDDSGFLTGAPGQREVLTCGIDLGGGERVGVNLGTTVLEPDEVLEQFELAAGQNDDELTVLDGDAAGLDGDSVVAVAYGDYASFTWVDDDFHVALAIPSDVAGADRGFEALPVLVDAVAEALGGD
jgi:hypothetical protein